MLPHKRGNYTIYKSNRNKCLFFLLTVQYLFEKDLATLDLPVVKYCQQFCGNNPETMAAAAKLAENYCDAIDINLGCPQAIAKRGRYGSFLQDEWELLQSIGKHKLICCLHLTIRACYMSIT